MRGVAPGRRGAEEEGQLVPVRADERERPGALLVPLGAQRRGHVRGQVRDGRHLRMRAPGERHGGLVRVRGGLGAVGQRCVVLLEGVCQQPQDVQPAVQQPGTGGGQVLVPHLEGRLLLGAPAVRAAGGLEQCVALAQDPLVVRRGLAQGRPQLHHELVQEPAPTPRLSRHQPEVLGREHHGPQDPQALPGTDGGAAVDGHPVRAAREDLQLEGHGAPAAVHAAGDPGAVLTEPHQLGVLAHAVGLVGAEVADGLHQVGLAHPVGAQQHGGPRTQLQVRPAVGAEVRDGEVGQVHGCGQPPAVRSGGPASRGTDGPRRSRTPRRRP